MYTICFNAGRAMKIFNIHDAKTHLSDLVERASRGDSFVIARTGKPLVKVTALDAPEAGAVRRLGFLSGHINVPEDFDRMSGEVIEQLFEGTEA
jgi:prevent-host-death family protein